MAKEMHPKVARAMNNITNCIIDLIVRNRGEVFLQQIERYTGLNNISNTITADIIRWMVKDNIIRLENDRVVGSVASLRKILEQSKTKLPAHHGKPWSEMDYILLSELGLAKTPMNIIAQKLGRTESSCEMAATLLRKAYRLIPLIKKDKTVRDFASQQVSPNPED